MCWFAVNRTLVSIKVDPLRRAVLLIMSLIKRCIYMLYMPFWHLNISVLERNLKVRNLSLTEMK